jgi:hypothetical protein
MALESGLAPVLGRLQVGGTSEDQGSQFDSTYVIGAPAALSATASAHQRGKFSLARTASHKAIHDFSF